jgi:predicted metal-dependent RNase
MQWNPKKLMEYQTNLSTLNCEDMNDLTNDIKSAAYKAGHSLAPTNKNPWFDSECRKTS